MAESVSTFFGVAVKPNSSSPIEMEEGTLIHLSNICISNNDTKGSTIVQLKVKDQTQTLCRLVNGTYEQHQCDIFFAASEDCQFVTKGPHEVHFVGFVEHTMEMDSDIENGSDMDMDEEDSDMC